MRIISGQWKGRSLLVSPKFKGRPTTDFAREGLFNVLQNQIDLDSAQVLELFAGTGAFGLECLSRWDCEITAIELQFLHVDWIKKNYLHFEVKRARAIQQDVFKYLGNDNSQKFDLIFADPPFDLKELGELPKRIIPLLKPGALLVLEHPKSYQFQELPEFLKEKKYANVHFSFFQQMGQ